MVTHMLMAPVKREGLSLFLWLYCRIKYIDYVQYIRPGRVLLCVCSFFPKGLSLELSKACVVRMYY